ncbi:hypothetical protein ASC97_23370 [Rhizobium sp. Root1203]|uniref:hypothetical protein n=1 Tax=Rhizobium sp. Root1203 TaxID=1736427 RepID=UPI00070F6239|nr:hypothetical protein [Rhizobium sp. Root1203]KQV29707.1 hypothetical protein ASC97_23370 [Rhizobium sp. Root1203]
MTKNDINHVQHGWALLALRLPGIRALSGSAHHIAELCESYSLANLYLDKLHRERPNDPAVKEYEELRRGIEQEVSYYLPWFSRLAG